VLSGSTQKTLGGPIGGLVLMADRAFGERVVKDTSGLIANYHNNRVAALAVTLAETAQFGAAYAAQTVENARTLAFALADRGVPVLGQAPRYTESHVVLIDPASLRDGETGFLRLEAAGILTTRVPLPASYPARLGIRLGTPAVTRAGMKAADMEWVATLIERILLQRQSPDLVAAETAALARRFPDVKYCLE
jgi:glycine hydroxymethyltransferase